MLTTMAKFQERAASGDSYTQVLAPSTATIGAPMHLGTGSSASCCGEDSFTGVLLRALLGTGGSLKTGVVHQVGQFVRSGPQLITELAVGGYYANHGGIELYGYDVLWTASGFSGAVTTAQTVVSSTFGGGMRPDTFASGRGLEILVFPTVATGATAANLTVNY